LNARLENERIDVTLSPRPECKGSIHPVSQTIEEMISIFAEMGFSAAEGPGNRRRFPQLHRAQLPARSSGAPDARHILLPDVPGKDRREAKRLLRTHTSTVQVRM
jgi:phenylalanyl-tRNA synthetase alpha chain